MVRGYGFDDDRGYCGGRYSERGDDGDTRACARRRAEGCLSYCRLNGSSGSWK